MPPPWHQQVQLPRPPLPPPPPIRHYHYHYIMHTICELNNDGNAQLRTEISNEERTALLHFQQQFNLPAAPHNNMFFENHVVLIEHENIQNPQIEHPLPFEIQHRHVYWHIHYHHLDEPVGYFNRTHMRNHIPSLEVLIEVQNRYPPDHIHTHFEFHFEWDGALVTSGETSEEEEDEEMNDDDDDDDDATGDAGDDDATGGE